ncbi:MAG: hypothetical protein ACK4GU_12225 [Alishewanella aestuarii]
MKQLKRALLSTAVLAGLYAGNAMAGTEACFEVLKATDDASATEIFQRWSTVYQKAGCEVGPGAPDQQLAGFNPISVAYELTGNLQLNFNDVDGNAVADDLALPFYIPTTDLPGGSRIQVAIEGGRFANNGNQLHLIQVTRTDVGGGVFEYAFESVASSDGVVDRTGSIAAGFTGGQLVTFVTKAANTVGAGTRLFISRTSVNATVQIDETTDTFTTGSYTALQPLNIGINNTGCPANPDVLLRATSARTDGGSTIIGGQSSNNVANSVLTLVSASPQFAMFVTGGQAGATVAEVNAEVPSLRTEFVFDNSGANPNAWTPTRVRPDFAWFQQHATNNGDNLDRAVALAAGDRVQLHVAATNPTGSTVVFDAYQDLDAAAGDSTSSAIGDVFNTALSWSTTFGGALALDNISIPTAADPATTPARYIDANAVFQDSTGAQFPTYFTVENTNDGVMNFNYDVNVRYGIDFVNANYIDLSPACNPFVNTHDIGVNGAVLKVPYVVDAASNFVRISNEHTSEALITMDIFGEDPATGSAGKETVNVQIGSLPAKASVVYNIADLLELARDAGYAEYVGATVANGQATNGRRHFVTFTVTAPKNKVHGVAVQRITNGVDRVIPVLDQNDWNQ